MESSFKRQFAALIAFLVIGAGAFSGLYFFVRNTEPNNKTADSSASSRFGAEETAFASLADGPIRIRRNEPVRLENAIVTFRGLSGNDTLMLDIVIPALDPDVTYRRHMDISSGKRGFQLANRQFRLVSAWKYSIKLERVSEQG